ncbi:SGNH/GDSL hydrolase family protein [Methylocapsa polymorpha]|uniref:SGNH/GDSL hydrolase family protein n=1 Tax=Methylocapsa polymorpha TaxID=3080828 RepID=A0ABZ0HN73_9HYPH|nr:SGNH/GDSL hydrolase family protein [Methylocapsa sp. RX1]
MTPSLVVPPQSLTLAMPRRRIASVHGGFQNPDVSQSNGGTQVSGTDRFSFVLNTDVTNLEFVFVNAYSSNGGLLNQNGNALVFHAALEVANQLYSIPFNSSTGATISTATGARSGVALADGGIAHSLPFGVGGLSLTAGSTQYYRVYKTVSSGQKWPYINENSFYGWGGVNTTDFVYGSTVVNGSDQTTSYGAQSWGAFASTSYAWSALAIIGEQITPAPVVGIFGDSIAAGNGSTRGLGYIGQACLNAGVAFHNNGMAGASLTNMIKYEPVRPYLARFVDYAILHMLTNDLSTASITTLAQAQVLLLQWVKAYGHKTNRVAICTILPRTTSTDTWATQTNQTVSSWESVRVQINNWLRDQTSTGAVAYLNANQNVTTVIQTIDVCPAIEVNSSGSTLSLSSNGQQTTGTGGFWKTTGASSYTTDGIHPTSTAVTVMATLVPTANFALF